MKHGKNARYLTANMKNPLAFYFCNVMSFRVKQDIQKNSERLDFTHQDLIR